tara:strand:+ start:4911 stop:5357 length:447 start_codon:yes stop_codon:yes gene_type:complete
MVSKAFTFPHSNFIGFDHIWSEIERLSTMTHQGDYPRHNVVRESETEFNIELALAGFRENELEVEVKAGVLIVKGHKEPAKTEYLHKGISTKNFVKTFRLSEHVVVDGADFLNGLLVVKLRVELPEEKRPRKISIGNTGDKKSELLVE